MGGSAVNGILATAEFGGEGVLIHGEESANLIHHVFWHTSGKCESGELASRACALVSHQRRACAMEAFLAGGSFKGRSKGSKKSKEDVQGKRVLPWVEK